MITGETPNAERARIIADFKAYRVRALVNCGVLTTGFNHPGVDLIFAARPTESTGLYVQIAGRGTRPVYAPGMPLGTRAERIAAILAGPCPNCLFLDFGGLVRRHGPIDMVEPKKPGKGGGDAPVKSCPECSSIVHASVMQCPDCGHIWERELSDKITKTAANTPILSTGSAIWKRIEQRRFHRHEKFGSPPSVRVEYLEAAGGVANAFKEWVSFENPRAAGLAAKWWRQHGGQEPTPATVSDALGRVGELKPIDEIRIEPSGKYWKVTGRRFAAGEADPSEAVEAKRFAAAGPAPIQPFEAKQIRSWHRPQGGAVAPLGAAPKPDDGSFSGPIEKPFDRYAFAHDLDDDVPF
jgi:DNA repair protein RadD